MAAIAIIEDESLLAKSIARSLRRQGHEVEIADDGEGGLALVRRMRPDLLLLDLRFPGLGGMALLRTVRQGDPDLLVVIMTAYGEVDTAVEAMKLGAVDFLRKPVDLEELKLVVARCLENVRLKHRLSYYEARDGRQESSFDMVGESPAMRQLGELIGRCAAVAGVPPPELPVVLIQGETGTGKELVARRLHLQSPYADQPFVEINCASLPSALVESELFGYERGAFTDAQASKPGLFELAEQGTMFLDEIGELSHDTQAKLLRALEQRRSRRLGGVHDRPIQCRIVAATNRDLARATAEGAFRQDLFYRIHGVVLRIPPLRDRGGDLALLTRHFLSQMARKYARPGLSLSDGARAAMADHHWPGNVRELRHALERAAMLSDGDTVHPAALGLGSPFATPLGPAAQDTQAPRAPARETAGTLPEGMTLDELERRVIAAALHEAGGNVSRAARRLGIGREALRYRLRKQVPPAAES